MNRAAYPVMEEGMNQLTQSERTTVWRRRGFYLLVALSFLMILFFNLLTPMMMDDFSYGAQVRGADSLWDLILQERNQYLTWNGRSVVHMILRCFLLAPTALFKVANSLVFLLLSYLIYDNIEGRGAYDCFVWLLVQAGLWLFAVDFAQTVLWETGACNYLWGTTIILSFMTALRRRCGKESGSAGGPRCGMAERKSGEAAGSRSWRDAAVAVGFFFFGVIAGWCNENTSGGSLLFVLVLLGQALYGRRKAVYPEGKTAERKRTAQGLCGARFPWFLATAAAGNLTGLLIMVSAPGNAIRASFSEENYTGLIGMIARVQKVTLNLRDQFEVLLGVLVVTAVIALLQRRPLRALRRQGLYAFLFLATSYALILTAETQARAFFGAGIFLLIACIQGLRDVCETERGAASTISGAMERRGVQKPDSGLVMPESQAAGAGAGGGIAVRAAVYGALGVLLLELFFTYVDCGTNLGRIYRECRERETLIEQARENGEDAVTVAQLRPAFENRYSAAYDGDLKEDPGYWTNVAMEDYFGVSSISALEREQWEEAGGGE